MAALVRTVHHPAQLAALSVLPLRQTSPRGAIKLDAPKMGESERAAWEKRLNRAFHACGCGEASLGTLVGLIASGTWVGIRIVNTGGTGLGDLFIVLAGVVIGTTFGKIAGLVRAEAKLHRLVRELQTEWKAEPLRFADDDCG
jgi:hypothetical protein